MDRSRLAEFGKLKNACEIQDLLLETLGPARFDDMFGSGIDWKDLANRISKDIVSTHGHFRHCQHLQVFAVKLRSCCSFNTL